MLASLTWLLLFGSFGPPAHADPTPPTTADRPVRLTVEIAWTNPAVEAGEIILEVSEGRVIDAVAWPGSSGATRGPERQAENLWRLGAERSGKVRARIEAPVASSLLLRAGGQAMRFPLPLVLEGAQHTGPQSPVEITVERVAWDVIGVALGPAKETAEGVVAPGAKVPITVGFNVLTPEPMEVVLRCSAELRPLRGGEPVWRSEIRETVPTNATAPTTFSLPVQAPTVEGTYLLDLKATWEAAPAHDRGKLISRLIRRGTRTLFGSSTASRRVTLAVLDPSKAETTQPLATTSTPRRDVEVDTIDLSRTRVYRPTASGRAPLSGSAWPVPEEALAEPTRRDLLRGWISRAGSEAAQLGPVDASGLAWSAVGLRVAHPGRPHRLTLKVAAGQPSAVGVALVGVGAAAAGVRPRLLLDACASGPPVAVDGPAATFSWLVWPGSADPVLVLSNRSSAGVVQVGTVTLTELAEIPSGPAIDEPKGTLARVLGLYLGGPDPLERFGASADPGLADVLGASRNLGAYLGSCGASAVVLPETLADRDRRAALDGTATEDAIGPDRLDLTLRVLATRKVATWLELAFNGALPGLPDPGSDEALARGLTRIDRRGLVDQPGVYQPLNDEVRAAMRRRVAEVFAGHDGPGRPAGALIRLGPGPTLLGAPDTGFDDATFARFVREAFDPETAKKSVPGLAVDDPGRFEARSKFLAGSGRTPWLSWRSEQVAVLYADLAEAARTASPGAVLAVATPALTDGPVGTEARRADLAGLAPSLAWRAVGLDLDTWPSGESAPIVLRGVGVGPDDLARDLATHPELDAKVASRPARGLLLDAPAPVSSRTASGRKAGAATGLTLSAPVVEFGPCGDEPLGHTLAALDPRWVWVAAPSVAGQEDRLRRFARVFRSLPATPPIERLPLSFGVSVRSHRAGGQTYLALANDTPYPVRLDTVVVGPASAPVYDFARSALLRPVADAAGRHIVLDLSPFGSSSLRVGSAEVKLASATTYPSEAVLTDIQARYAALSEQLSRLTSGGEKDKDKDKSGAGSGPPNPGFEPEATAHDAPPMQIGAAEPLVATSATLPVGWKVIGGEGDGLVIDPSRPHSGQGSLRIDAPAPPASAVSDDFAPQSHGFFVVRAWFRADRPETKVRVWIEGESTGKVFQRVSDLTVSSGWIERAVRASDVPPGGLDSVHLRFELLTAGSLWVDDLSVAGETLSGPERRNAVVALLAASQAFREKRYADFARLAGSRWARSLGPTETGPDGGATLTRTGDASALPPGRRLR